MEDSIRESLNQIRTHKPPQYSRQPGRPKKSRNKAAYEKHKDGTTVRKRMQNSLKCGNCGQQGHNRKTCQRHLPPKEKATASGNKRKITTGDGQTAQKQPKKRRSPMTNNELRQMIKERNEYMRLRKAALKASKLEANKTAPKRTKSVQGASVQRSSRPAASAPTTRSGPNASTNNTAPSRTSQRIGQNSGKGVRR